MRGYPKHVATKQDFLNLLSMPEYKAKAITDLKSIADLKDDKATIATTLKDSKNPEKGFNTKTIDNPNPVWKQKGFKNKKEILDLVARSIASD